MNEGVPKQESQKETFLHIERKSPDIREALTLAPIYKKDVLVRARKAVAGEEVKTITKTGDVETVNEAQDGDWIVTNASGEDYILPPAMFTQRYGDSDTPGIYHASGYCKAIENPYGKPIEILASWGTSQRGDEHCFIADTCDANGILHGEPYLIEGDAFKQTYSKIESL